jgi:assimilatory nitrate reductase catalytic subunit
MACPKGWEALTVLNSEDRATQPLLRGADGQLKAVSWHEALTTFVDRFKAIQEKHGAEALAWLGTGQIPTEELALLGALAKFGMGILHGDGNTRQCMATAAVAYKESFGFDAPPFTYKDFEESDVIFLVGSNLCIAHPILWERILRNKHKPEIIVIDPRKTETASASTRHISLKPKSDLALFYGLAHILIREGWIDRGSIEAHTSGYEAFAAFLQEFTPETVAAETSLSVAEIEELARIIHSGKRVSFWWTMGVNQNHEGVRTAQALINLALMTGNIGRPGTGANSITGQCNAMGSRLYSNTTNLLGGHDFTCAGHRAKIASILNIDPARIPARNSVAYNEIVDAIRDGKIKGLWVIATNSAHSWINQRDFHETVKKLEFLVVQDMYHNTETAQFADLALPAAGWGEKEGTFINSERRIGLVKKVAKAPGLALADFSIFKLIAHYWGCGDMFKDWSDAESVFHILKKISGGQPCDITGIRDYRHIDEQGGIQWPASDGLESIANERRLFEDGRFFHPGHRARFIFEQLRALPEPVDAQYPFFLITGRGSVAQWHTQTRTKQSAVLRRLHPQNTHVEIHPLDARRLALSTNDAVIVESRRGQLNATALVSHLVKPGQVFIPMHDAAVNQLTHPTFDPYSKQPGYKACAVRIRPVS